jgi:hypothetical protein
MSCHVERRATITHSKLNIVTGVTTRGETEIVERECGTPLFGDRERKVGVCRSCLKGWEVEGNAPTARGREQIAAAQAKLDAGEVR